MTTDRHHTTLRRTALAFLTVTAGACSTGSDDEPSDATAAPSTTDQPEGQDSAAVTIERSRYAPTEITTAVGETVTFTNLDAFAHTVTAVDGAPVDFDSGDVGQDESFEISFDAPGEYAYFCEIHPTMRATIIVE